MEIKDWIAISAFVISGGSLIISILLFQRNKKIENENHLFKCKLEVYQTITKEISNVLKSIDIKIQYLDKFIDSPNDEAKKTLLDQADKIDAEVIDFHFMVQGNLLVISDKVHKAIDEFIDFLFDSKVENYDSDSLQKAVNGCFTKAEEIVDEMRYDLNFEGLDTSLFKRLKN